MVVYKTFYKTAINAYLDKTMAAVNAQTKPNIKAPVKKASLVDTIKEAFDNVQSHARRGDGKLIDGGFGVLKIYQDTYPSQFLKAYSELFPENPNYDAWAAKLKIEGYANSVPVELNDALRCAETNNAQRLREHMDLARSFAEEANVSIPHEMIQKINSTREKYSH
jgi:hypothetical protein